VASTPGWTDSHCHVYGEDELAALARAAEAGVDVCVLIGTDEKHSRIAAAAAAADPPDRVVWPVRYATVGMHPHEASAGIEPIAALLSELVIPLGDGRPPGSVVGVGECGLDYFYDRSPRHVQLGVFAQHVLLAHGYSLTLVIHTRDAWDDTLRVLDDIGTPERTIIHCFTGGPREAEECLARGAYLSFSGIVTFKNADALREAAVLCPADRLLVETDAPYLAPVPHRGKPNEPAFVAIVGSFLAELRGEDPHELAATTSANALRAFAATR
jgi:TatD DNase family protein